MLGSHCISKAQGKDCLLENCFEHEQVRSRFSRFVLLQETASAVSRLPTSLLFRSSNFTALARTQSLENDKNLVRLTDRVYILDKFSLLNLDSCSLYIVVRKAWSLLWVLLVLCITFVQKLSLLQSDKCFRNFTFIMN